MKQVTNLIEQIGKCRDLIEEGDFKKILFNIYIFEKVYLEVKRNIDRYVKNPSYNLDFNHHDLSELSNEIAKYIEQFPSKFSSDLFLKSILDKNYEKIDNKILAKHTQEIMDLFSVDAKLRECQKVLAYYSFVLRLWTEQNKT